MKRIEADVTPARSNIEFVIQKVYDSEAAAAATVPRTVGQQVVLYARGGRCPYCGEQVARLGVEEQVCEGAVRYVRRWDGQGQPVYDDDGEPVVVVVEFQPSVQREVTFSPCGCVWDSQGGRHLDLVCVGDGSGPVTVVALRLVVAAGVARLRLSAGGLRRCLPGSADAGCYRDVMDDSSRIEQINTNRCCKSRSPGQAVQRRGTVVTENHGFTTADVLVLGTNAFMTVMEHNTDSSFTAAQTMRLSAEAAQQLANELQKAALHLRASQLRPPQGQGPAPEGNEQERSSS